MMKKRGKEIDYEAKTVMVAGRRYIVCRNRQEAEKDAADRASIVAALERQLAKGDKALVGNTGFRRYLKVGDANNCRRRDCTGSGEQQGGTQFSSPIAP
jgi:hypothetical protein